MEKWPFFRAATAGLGKYCMGGYGRIGIYRVKHAISVWVRGDSQNSLLLTTNLSQNVTDPSMGISYPVGDLC